MITSNSAVRTSYYIETNILFTGTTSIFSFRTMRSGKRRRLAFILNFRLKIHLQKKIRAYNLVSLFRMYYYCTKNKLSVSLFFA